MNKRDFVTIDFGDHILLAPQPINEPEIGRWFEILAGKGMAGSSGA